MIVARIAERLCEAGIIIADKKRDICKKILSNFTINAALLLLSFTHANDTHDITAKKPPYGPGLRKEPVRINLSLFEAKFPNTCIIPFTDSKPAAIANSNTVMCPANNGNILNNNIRIMPIHMHKYILWTYVSTLLLATLSKSKNDANNNETIRHMYAANLLNSHLFPVISLCINTHCDNSDLQYHCHLFFNISKYISVKSGDICSGTNTSDTTISRLTTK